MRPLLAWLLPLLVAGVAACDAPEAARPLAHLRLALAESLPPGIDAVTLTIETPDGPVARADLAPPWPPEVVLGASPGPARRVTFLATVAGLPVWMGASDPVDVAAETVVDVEVVVDPAGLLVVLPLDLDLLGVAVRAVPEDPPPGTPAAYDLTRDGGGFVAVVPAGRYALDFDLPLGLDALLPGGPAVVEVLPGVRNTWVEPFVAPGLPVPLPGPAVRLEVEVPGGRLLAGLLGLLSDLVVRARDADGRVVPGYRGTVSFEALAPLDLLLPDPYTFTEADAGEHRFRSVLGAPLALVGGLLRFVVRDDGGLEVTVEVPVRR